MSDEIFNITMAIQLCTFQLHLCCCAAPCHSEAFTTQRCFSPPTSPTTSCTFPGHTLTQHHHHYLLHNLSPHGRYRSHHLSLTTTIGISSSTTTTISSSTYYAHSSHHCTVLQHSFHLDDCATHTPTPTHPTDTMFPSAAPSPSYMLPQLHPTPPAEPNPTGQTHSLPAPQQATVAHHPSTDPQCTIPQGVWQPYSVFPPRNLHLNLCLHRRLHKPSALHHQFNPQSHNRRHRTPHHRSNSSLPHRSKT